MENKNIEEIMAKNINEAIMEQNWEMVACHCAVMKEYAERQMEAQK